MDHTQKSTAPVLRFVPISEIRVVLERFRDGVGDRADFDQLRGSIKEKGVLQPITLDTDLNLIAGYRRFKAVDELGIEEIPALIRKVDDEIDARECELIENVNRLDMTWQEKTALIDEINRLHMEKYGRAGGKDATKGKWSETKTADLVGKNRRSVGRSLRLAEAMKIMPELAKCKTEDEAVKRLKRLEEETLIAIMRKKQQESAGVHNLVRAASCNYRVGDALGAMKEIAGSEGETVIRLIEVDPPYAIDLSAVKRREAGLNVDLDEYSEIDAKDYPDFIHSVARLTYSCASKDCWMIFWFGPTWHSLVHGALTAAGWQLDDIPGIWYKGGGQTNAPEVYLARSYEPFFMCRKGQPLIKERGRSNVFQHMPVPAGQKYHPTQRPLELMKDLLDTFAYPGSVVMAPFLGSGVTLRAVYQLDMLGFGWDLSKESRDRFLLEVQSDADRLDSSKSAVSG